MTKADKTITFHVLLELCELRKVGVITSKELATTRAFVTKTDMTAFFNMRVSDCADLMIELASV
jgi:hypothetical protein